MFSFFYSSIVQANPTDELEERLQQMSLPDPSVQDKSHVNSNEILYYYPYVIEYLQNLVRSLI